MAFNINDMRAQLVYGGARPNQFQVQITNPANATADLRAPFLVQAASIPTDTIGETIVGYFGRQIKYAGDRTFDPWTVTIINDEDFLVRNALEQWMASINSHQGNMNTFTSNAPMAYKSQAQVRQFGKSGLVVREYTFSGLFPTQLGEIALDWNNNNQVETFQVTFAYDFWEVSGGNTGDAGTTR